MKKRLEDTGKRPAFGLRKRGKATTELCKETLNTGRIVKRRRWRLSFHRDTPALELSHYRMFAAPPPSHCRTSVAHSRFAAAVRRSLPSVRQPCLHQTRRICPELWLTRNPGVLKIKEERAVSDMGSRRPFAAYFGSCGASQRAADFCCCLTSPLGLGNG